VHLYQTPGVYEITLTVKDNSGTATDTASTTLQMEINGPPVVDIGPDVITTCPDRPTGFDASPSYDPNGDPLTFAWDFGDGERATDPVTEHVYTKTGRYVASASASDGREMICSQTTASQVVLVNDAPIADAGPDALVNPGDSLPFDGSASLDQDGKVTAYAWNFGDGATADGANVEHAFQKPGTYAVTLTVADDSGLPCNRGSDEMIVTVNTSPSANAGLDQKNVCDKTIHFDAGGSSDSDGSITAYEWDFGDGSPVGVGPNPTHNYAAPGTYTVTLRVTDDSELVSGTHTDSMLVVINDTPVPIIQADKEVCPGAQFSLSAGESYDPDGSITAYRWDFGDDSAVKTGKNTTYMYEASGEYPVTLAVDDNSGSECGTSTVKQIITVNTPPVAEAGEDLITCVQTTGCGITLDAGESSDADNDNLTYHWDFGDGNSQDGIRVQYEYANPGTYTVTLTVTDDSGVPCNTATDTLKVTANAPPDADLKEQRGN
jgi:PKD repeat protein